MIIDKMTAEDVPDRPAMRALLAYMASRNRPSVAWHPHAMTPGELLEARAIYAAAIAEVGPNLYTPFAAEVTDELARRGITRDTILSVSLMCGGIAGWLDDKLARLIADPMPVVALDLAEQRELDKPGGWLPWRREVSWPAPAWRSHQVIAARLRLDAGNRINADAWIATVPADERALAVQCLQAAMQSALFPATPQGMVAFAFALAEHLGRR